MPYTVPQDLLGLPACSVPVGFDADGLPVAVQVTGPFGREDLVIEGAKVVEQASRVVGVWPPVAR